MRYLNKKIILFGAGNDDRTITTYITENYKNIICIVDNDSTKWGENINGYSIKNPHIICDYLDDKDIIIVVAAFRYHKEIAEQIRSFGWDSERITVAINEIPFFKSRDFYIYLHNSDLLHPIPTELNIELSGFCNCKCIYCPFHGEPNLKDGHKGFMNWETLNAIIKLVKKIPTIKAVDTTGPGEIFLNKTWYEMLKKLLDNTNIETVVIYTNGMLLTEENARKIALLEAKKIRVEVSIDGESQEENDEYRIGSNYVTVKENVNVALQIFKESKCKIELVITNCYPAKMEDIERSKYKSISRYNPVPQFLQEDFGEVTLISQKTFSYGKDEFSKFKTIKVELPESERNGCINLFYRLAINFEGKLLRCSCGHAGIEGIGSVFSDDILDLWYNEEQIQKARRNFIEKNLEDDFCTGCPGKGLEEFSLLVKK